ncbi:MAG: hypothetical protein CMB74_04875 [Euryarchaeota archaeon]|nr:hypothetical protein [Euryarchaeota archaeon]|tara:strand:+ start:200 stop:628 length:429 start_codon:yes stop_codon:yes gene_type:complete
MSSENEDEIRKILEEVKCRTISFSDLASIISENILQESNSTANSSDKGLEADHFDVGVSHFYQDLIAKMDNGWIWHIPKTGECFQIDKENKCFVVLVNKETSEMLTAQLGISEYTDYEVIDLRRHLQNHDGKKYTEIFPWYS